VAASGRRDGEAAERAAALQREPWAQELGVEYLELGPGRCRVALTLRPSMLNHQGSPHGGVIFSLADVAFGAACNSRGGTWVALSMTISYLTAAPAGARLVAEARERRHGRRAGFYDVTVSADGSTIAAVHGVAHRVGEPSSPAS
jgi:acyl-CoA thioesterase